MTDDLKFLREYISEKFEELKEQVKEIKSEHKDHVDNTNSTLNSINSNLDDMGSTLERLTVTVEQHEQRSTNLEIEFRPIREHHLKQQIIDEYKAQKTKEWKAKWKTPSALLVGLSGTSLFTGVITYFWDFIRGIFK